jgi:hypothetical protein
MYFRNHQNKSRKNQLKWQKKKTISFEVIRAQEELTRFSDINKVMSMLDESEINVVFVSRDRL